MFVGKKRSLNSSVPGLLLLVFSFASALAAESPSDLVEAARKEGEVVFYGSMSLANADALRSRFQHKYPFIQAKLNRVGGGKILSKVMIELRAKKYLPHVFQ